MREPTNTITRGDAAVAPLTVAIAGLGAVGMQVANALDAGIAGLELTAIAVRDEQKAREKLGSRCKNVSLVGLAELEGLADIVVECAPAAILRDIVEPFVLAGKKAVVLSCGALLSNIDLIDKARSHGGQIVVPSGAVLGLDAVTAAAVGEIHSVTMTTRKPVAGLIGAPHLVKNDIRIDDITEPLLVFSGTPRDAAVGFPANLNVAVALALAGIGPDRTRLEIWADPTVTRNVHVIAVEADSARFSMSIENIPSDNPKTGRITALSVIAALTKMNAPLRVGT